MARRFPALVTAALFISAAFGVPATAQIASKTSPHSVEDTMDRLEAAVTGAGATVFARIDHAAGSKRVEMDLRPTQVLLFGNPNLGTPAMIAAQTAGLDLPLRVLVYADPEGVVHVAYHNPDTLAADHGLPSDAPYLGMMSGALDKLTAQAIAAE